MAPRIGPVIETALYVTNLERSVDFYKRVLGFKPNSAPEGRLCAMDVTDDQVLLVCQKGASVNADVEPYGTIPPHDGEGSLHVCFAIPDAELDTWREHLHACDVEIESAVTWPNGGRSLYFRDPDWHCVELKSSNWHGKPPAI